MTPLGPSLEARAAALIDAAFRGLGRVPDGAVRRLSRVAGDVWFAVDVRHRRVALANLAKAFGRETGPADRRRLARRVFANLVRMLFEIGRALNVRPEAFLDGIRIEGRENFEKTFPQGRGYIAITAHTGNWELLACLAAISPVRINIVYRPLDFPPLDAFFRRFRTRFGGRLIGKTDALKRLFACLRQNEVIALVMDQNVGKKKGVFVDFFGDIACTTKGPAYLALLTGAPVLPVFMSRTGGELVIHVGEQIPTQRTGDRDRDIAANTLRYNRAIEAFIRRHPDQWLWLHQRWKTRPGKTKKARRK